MGLVKLYRVTGEKHYLDLAHIFLEARGPGGPTYNQRHLKVADQTEAVGHAVRANYLYSGMADVAALAGDTRYLGALDKIWENVTAKKLYLTGGVGALADGEAYGADYQLPTAGYNETCAAVALMTWNHRMFLLTGDSKYMDEFERTCFNGFISGVSVSGDRFFYTNPLDYDGHLKNNHDHAGRAPWFGCACCPPNLMRTLASLTGYFYAVKANALYVNFYAESTGEAVVSGSKVKLTQTTDYPWQGGVRLAVTPDAPLTFELRVRIPGWVQGRPVASDLYTYADPQPAAWTVRVNGEVITAPLAEGYAVITREWHPGDVVEINFPMPVRAVRGNSLIQATVDRVAFERGPVVYCIEDTQSSFSPGEVAVPSNAVISPERPAEFLGGVTVLQIKGVRRPLRTGVRETLSEPTQLTAIPYFAWNNRGLAPMAVWLKRAP
jgi:DUF1680 family protein